MTSEPKRERKGNVIAFKPGITIPSTVNHSGEDDDDVSWEGPKPFECECGSQWFYAIVAFEDTPLGPGKVTAYTRYDPQRGAQIKCIGCPKIYS